MQEISSKFENILTILNTKYGFNLEANESLEISLDLKNSSLPPNPGKKGDRHGSGEATLYWNDKYNCWLPKDYFNATATDLGDSKLKPISPENKKIILESISKLSELDLLSFVKDISEDFEKFYPKDLIKIKNSIKELENEKESIQADKEKDKKRLLVEKDSKEIEKYKGSILKYDMDVKDIEEEIEDLKRDFKKVYEEREKTEKEIIKKFNGFSSSLKGLIKDYNSLINFFEKNQGKEEAKKFKRLVIRLDDPKELYAEIEETSSFSEDPKSDPQKNELEEKDIAFIKNIIKQNPDINKYNFENKIKNNFNENLLVKILENFEDYKKEVVTKNYVPEMDLKKKELTKEDLKYIENIISKKPGMSRGELIKEIKNKFNPYLVNLMEVAWERDGDPKKSEATNFLNNFIKNYDKNIYNFKVNLKIIDDIEERGMGSRKKIPSLGGELKPVYDFLSEAKEVSDKQKYENSFLGYTERFLNAVEDYASSSKQYPEIDYIIAEVLTGVNLLDREGLVKVWKKLNIPKISDNFENFGEKLSDLLSFKEVSVPMPKKDKDDKDSERDDHKRTTLLYKEISDNVIKRLDGIKNPPGFIKEFKDLVKNIPKFEYADADEKSTSKKRKLNTPDVDLASEVLDKIKKTELKKTIPDKSKEEIDLQRQEFKKKLTEEETNKLLKHFNKVDDSQFKDMKELSIKTKQKDEEIENKQKDLEEKKREIKQRKDLVKKKFKEDAFISLQNKIESLEKKLEKEDNPDNIQKMNKDLSFYKKEIEKITEEQKKKSDLVQKEIQEIQDNIKELNENLNKIKSEKKTFEKQKDILKEKNKMYENFGSWYKGLLEKSQETKKYEKSIKVRRDKIVKEKEEIEKENKNIKEKSDETENKNLKTKYKSLIKLNEDKISFLENAIEELSYFLTKDGDVIGLSPKLQEKYLEKNIEAITDQALKTFPDLLFKWVPDSEIEDKIKKIESKLYDLQQKTEITKEDKKVIENYKEDLKNLDFKKLKKVRVDKDEALKKIESIRDYFLTPQEVNGETFYPKKNLITKEDYLEFIKKYEAGLEKIEKMREEGLKMDKYLKEIYLVPTLLDITDVSEEDLSKKEIDNTRPLSIFKQDAATSKNKKAPMTESTVITDQIAKNIKDIKKIKSQFENYIDLLDVKGDKKWDDFFKKIEKISSNLSNLLDNLMNNRVLSLSDKEKDLDTSEKEKIWKNKRDKFLSKFRETLLDFKDILSQNIEDKEFEKIMKLRRRAFDINSYLDSYDVSKIDYDYVDKKIDYISNKKFKNKEDLKNFVEEKEYSFKNSSKMNLEDFLSKLEDEIKEHYKQKNKNKKLEENEESVWEESNEKLIKAGSVMLKTENSILYRIEKLSHSIQDPFIKLEINSISNILKELV